MPASDGYSLFKHGPRVQAALLAGITLAVFAPTLSAGFVYDARLQILTDPFLHDWRNWGDVLTFRTLARDVLDFNRPVHLASLMLDAAIWGKEPFGYHLTSVLLHVANVLMVWWLIREMGSRPDNCGGTENLEKVSHAARPAALPDTAGWTACLAALIFAVHPVVTEAVCEPTFREDLLATAFSLLAIVAMLLALRHGTPPAATGGAGRWWAVGIAACCLLAVASKESGAVAPALVATTWWLCRRGSPTGFKRIAIGGGAAAVAAFLTARFLLEPTPSVIFESRPQYPGGSLAAAMMIEPRILALYAQLILLPVNQCADYGLYSVRHLPLAVALVILAAIVVAACLAIRADRRMALAVAMIALPLLPVANVFPIYRAAADRYLYFPMAGVGLAIGFLLDAPWLKAHKELREKALIGCTAAIVLFTVACVERQAVWANPLNLWEDTYRKNPVAFTAASGLGEALREIGRLPEAEKATREAIRLSEEKRGDVWATLAIILDEQGREQEAHEALDKALQADPKLAKPDARVKALAMEQPVADALDRLLQRHSTR